MVTSWLQRPRIRSLCTNISNFLILHGEWIEGRLVGRLATEVLALKAENDNVQRHDGAQTMMIGDRIRQIREMRGITHDDLEEVSGLERSYLARVEQGRTVPPLEALERIAAALSVPLYWLFFVEDDGLPAMQSSSPKPVARTAAEAQLMRKLKGVSGAPFEADTAFLLEFARRAVLGKPEN